LNLYKKEESELMAEFEEMKKREKLIEYENQNQLIQDYKKEEDKLHKNIVDKALKIKIDGSTEVRQEKMALETIKTVNYNKFSKA